MAEESGKGNNSSLQSGNTHQLVQEVCTGIHRSFNEVLAGVHGAFDPAEGIAADDNGQSGGSDAGQTDHAADDALTEHAPLCNGGHAHAQCKKK